jgi:hypothetical protein
LWPRGLGGITKNDVLVLGLAAALTLGSAPTEATAAAEALALRWHAPAGCPTEAQARDLVGRLLPGPGARVRTTVTIDAVLGGYAGTVELPTGTTPTMRSLQAEDCVVLARAMAVVIAVSLDPVAVAEAAQASAVPEPVASPVPDGSALPRVPADEPSPEPSPRRMGSSGDAFAEPRPTRRDLEGGARLGAGVGGFLFPAAGVGLSLAPFVGTSRLHVRAVAQYWAPQRIAFDPARDAQGELQLLTGGLRVCPQLGGARVRFPVCAGADAGAILGRGTGRDLAILRSARSPWVGAVLEPGVVVGVTSRVSLWLALEGVVSLYRPRFVVEGAPRGFTAGAGALRGLLGVQVHGRRDRPQNP